MIFIVKMVSLEENSGIEGKRIKGFRGRRLSEKMRAPWHFFTFGGTALYVTDICLSHRGPTLLSFGIALRNPAAY